VHSDFVVQTVGAKDKDRFLDHIFPAGGHNHAQDEDSLQFRRRFDESYMYSDHNSSGR